MPIISLDLRQTPLIDAQLTVSYSHLNEVLRVVIENANNQDQRISELQSQIHGLQGENETIRAELRDLKLQQEKMLQERERSVDTSSIEASLKALRDDLMRVVDQQEAFATSTRFELDALDKRLQKENQSTSMAFSTVQEKWDTLHRAVSELQSATGSLKAFVSLWGSSESSINRLSSEGTAVEHRDFLVSLAPFQEVIRLLENQSKPVEDLSAIASLKHTEFTDIISKLHGDIAALRNAIEVIERRLRAMSDGDERLRECEEKIRVLDATKADVLSVSSKTDKETTGSLAQRVQGLHEELAAMLDRLNNAQVAPDSHSGRNPRRPSSTAYASDDALKRRVAALETEATNLEQKKADRSELTRLYEMVDTITRGNPIAVTSPPQQIAADVTPPPLKARPPSSSAAKRIPESPVEAPPQLPPVEINTRGTSHSPQRQGSARPLFVARSSSVTVRDSSGGLTSASLACMAR